MTTVSIEDGIYTHRLDSWREFLDIDLDEHHGASGLIFRGQERAEWKLQSSLDRLREKHPKRRNLSGYKPEFHNAPPLTAEEHLKAFKRCIRGRNPLMGFSLSDDDIWALGQHHGLATPFLDWTRSPYVALFFAFEKEIYDESGEASGNAERAVFAAGWHLFDSAANEHNELRRLRAFSPNHAEDGRLISQSGLFVELPEDMALEKAIQIAYKGESERSRLTKFIIPDNERSKCLAALSKMNINRMTLFPDIDGAAAFVNSLWQPGHEEATSYI